MKRTMPPGVVRFLLFLGLAAGIAGGATWGFNTLWRAVGGGEMSLHGWIALGLGIVGAFGLAWLLMTLAFRSDRRLGRPGGQLVRSGAGG